VCSQVCRETAPTVYDIERASKERVNFVMLNVDNIKVSPPHAIALLLGSLLSLTALCAVGA
jgi:hypothetical protein